MYRYLGTTGICDPTLRPLYSGLYQGYKLCHVEGTNTQDSTCPTIGSGAAKLCRDASMKGYCVGATLNDDDKTPFLISYESDHILSYDIEAEYSGPGECSYESPILCISMVCSCGWKFCVTRRSLTSRVIPYVVKTTNLEIAECTMRAIMSHKPIFTVGHNVYGYDNKVLALALGGSHVLSKYFHRVMSSEAATFAEFGLMMTIPGINNLDTYRFIRQSMFGTFKKFSLDALCKANDIPTPKLVSTNRVFSESWYNDNGVNAMDMVVYNIQDCIATLELCKKLDLVNQIVCLCYTARAWVNDVLMYSTGVMATSCLCSHAYKRGYLFNWTRCDWRPEVFRGGEVIYTGPCLVSNVMIVDFVSMYPSIMSSCGISPESIDFIDQDMRSTARFNSLGYLAQYKPRGDHMILLCIVYGIVARNNERPTRLSIIGEICNCQGVPSITPDELLDYTTLICTSLASNDSSISNLPFSEFNVISSVDNPNDVCDRLDIMERMTQLNNQMLSTDITGRWTCNKNIEWLWVPKLVITKGHSVDWIGSALSHSTIVHTPEYECHFTYGPRTSAVACRDLMTTRKTYKHLMNVERGRDISKSRAYDKIQYALKISANSMYGALSFAHYNTYSPRCGMSVTAIGRWSLNVAVTIIASLGFDVVYGDTDSVMFCMPRTVPINNSPLRVLYDPPIKPYIAELASCCAPELVCEYLCGSKGSHGLCPDSYGYMRGITSKIVNIVLSYTCVNELILEHQSTERITTNNIESSVISRLMVMARKHYIGLLSDGDTIDKGVSYVRRSGASLKDEALRRFSMAAMKYIERRDQITLLTVEYRNLCYMVTRGEPVETFTIQTTVSGLTGSYIKVVHSNVTYVKIHEFKMGTYVIDKKYYVSIIDKVLSSVCVCIGLHGTDCITTGMGALIRGV